MKEFINTDNQKKFTIIYNITALISMLIGTAFFLLAFYLPFLFPEYTLLICCLCVAIPLTIVTLSLSIVEKKYKKKNR